MEFMYNLFLLWQYSKLILLICISYDYIVKFMKLPYYKLKADKHLFAIYYLYYKKKLKTTNTTYDFRLRYNNKTNLELLLFYSSQKLFLFLFIPLKQLNSYRMIKSY